VAAYAIPEEDWPEEQGTIGIPFTFVDDADGETPVTPTAAAWRLTDSAGNVINERSGVTLTPATTALIVAYGADLAYTAAQGAKRQIIVYGTYDSATLGSGRPFVHVITFQVRPVAGWPAA
jgi:hypothetical protein